MLALIVWSWGGSSITSILLWWCYWLMIPHGLLLMVLLLWSRGMSTWEGVVTPGFSLVCLSLLLILVLVMPMEEVPSRNDLQTSKDHRATSLIGFRLKRRGMGAQGGSSVFSVKLGRVWAEKHKTEAITPQ